jgi:hypothetical protein
MDGHRVHLRHRAHLLRQLGNLHRPRDTLTSSRPSHSPANRRPVARHLERRPPACRKPLTRSLIAADVLVSGRAEMPNCGWCRHHITRAFCTALAVHDGTPRPLDQTSTRRGVRRTSSQTRSLLSLMGHRCHQGDLLMEPVAGRSALSSLAASARTRAAAAAQSWTAAQPPRAR